MLQLRYGNGRPSTPDRFPRSNPFIHYAEAVKESGTKLLVETIGGYQDPAVCERIIADGKADIIAMART